MSESADCIRLLENLRSSLLEPNPAKLEAGLESLERMKQRVACLGASPGLPAEGMRLCGLLEDCRTLVEAAAGFYGSVLMLCGAGYGPSGAYLETSLPPQHLVSG